MQATRIIAVRHGETTWNVDGRIQGQLDIPLNDKGRWQAERLARALAASERAAAIYSSDLLRAWDTARAVADSMRLQQTDAPGLRERGFGSYEGKTFPDLEANHPQETARWRRRDPDWAPPGGESLQAFRKRVLDATDELARRHIGEQIILVAHGGVLDVMYRRAIGAELAATRTWELANASINRLLWTPDALTVVGWADRSHLEDDWHDEVTT